jgi:hypothetical protein
VARSINELVKLQQTNTAILSYPKKLQKWISMQHYAYALKHGQKPNVNDNKHSCVKVVKKLTDSREEKLKANNFVFHLPWAEGRNQERWEHMFQRAAQHKEQHGTLSVSSYLDQQLHSWLLQQ